jgi:hydrogenase maturation protease
MIAVIACGNSNRSDDGVAAEVLRILANRGVARLAPGIRLLDSGTDGMAVMFAARGCRSLIVVDACRSGANPGTIFEVPGHELEQVRHASFTLHDFRWNHALFAGRQMFREDFPDDVTVLLIEAGSFALGTDLSQQVASAAHKVATRIEAILRQRLSLTAETTEIAR